LEKINNKIKEVVVYGGESMAGHVINEYLSCNDYKVIALDTSEIINYNGTSFNINEDKILNNVEIAINCIRCLVEDSEKNIDKANLYNSYFPKLLEKNYQKTNTRVIHLSTDCVFSGAKGNYFESDTPDGNSVYSKTKALGEINNEKDITIRTSYIGPNIDHYDEELFHWFLTQKNCTIKGFTKAFWNGVTTLELAKSIEKIININFSGIYHIAPKNYLSKYELLFMVKKLWNKEDLSLIKDETVSYNRTLIDSNKMIKISNYDVMLEELFDYMLERKKIYNQYFF
jgi:dTDP-4-dehydrorhamnose reductase